MKLKVCGITSIDQFNELAHLGVDYAGFIFYDQSPRYVVGKIDPDLVRDEKKLLKTGVFVDAYADDVQRYVEEYGLDLIQLHGNEDENYFRLLNPDLKKIKVIKVGDQSAAELQAMIDRFATVADYYLLDTYTEAHGGSGKRFDWEILNELEFNWPFFLSGGIGPGDAIEVKQLSHSYPFLHAVDINSRFETAPGIKNLEAIQKFIDEIA